METKRDSKGRSLKEGERQRSDGRYEYRYTGKSGETRSIYSWRLTQSDPQPPGKRRCEPLRDLEMDIRRDLEDGIDRCLASTMTLNEAYAMWFLGKAKLRDATKINYETNYDRYVRNTLGGMPVQNIKPSHIKSLYIAMQTKLDVSYGTVLIVQTVLHQVFDMLVRDDVIRKNPSIGAAKKQEVEIKPMAARHALTTSEQERFLDFIQTDKRSKKWAPLLIFLFGTGARIGEACALTWEDVDFEKRVVYICKTLTRDRDGGERSKVGRPKTKAGNREIPMTEAVYQTLSDGLTEALSDADDGSIQDRPVFRNQYGNRIAPEKFCNTLKKICNRYNRKMEDKIPSFSPHVIRHTFCTRLCERGVNPKVIQYVMGHDSITVTLDVYAEISSDFCREAFTNLGIIDISASSNLPRFVPRLTEKTWENMGKYDIAQQTICQK